MIKVRLISASISLITFMTISGCAVKPTGGANAPVTGHDFRKGVPATAPSAAASTATLPAAQSRPAGQTRDVKPESQRHLSATQNLTPLSIRTTQQTGRLKGSQLNEVSGISASTSYPGLLYAINDSGNSPTLYAIDETGRLLTQWNILASNRDWEDMTQWLAGDTRYLVIGDTGDNLRIRKSAALHLLREPEWPAATGKLTPEHTINFRYDDGPRNIEAFSIADNTLFLLSKEPVTADGHTPHRIYQLELPVDLNSLTSEKILTARFVGTMPTRAGGLVTKLVAALAGVDLTHPTAMEIDASTNTAYILTYSEVIRVKKSQTQSWADAFSGSAERILSHNLPQAEALSLSPGRAVWFTSENVGAPLWAIPLPSPL